MDKSGKKKILVPIFNRAHYGRLRSVLSAIRAHPELELQIIVASPAAYDYFLMNIRHSRPYSWPAALKWYVRARFLALLNFNRRTDVFKDDFLIRNLSADGFLINSRIPLFLDGGLNETMAKSVGLGMMKLVDELKRLNPNVVFINADRFEMMTVALAAAFLNIPIVHNEGGDLSGTIDESIRHAITKLAHLHLTATEMSRRRVIQMGENPRMVFTVGSPAIDSVKNLNTDIRRDLISGFDFTKSYLLVLLHPVTTETKEINTAMAKNLIAALEELKLPTVCLGSNIDASSDTIGMAIRNWRDTGRPAFVHFIKSLHPDDFYRILKHSVCAIGNSSSFIREGAYFGTPVVIIGSRQHNRDRGRNIREVESDKNKIISAVRKQLEHGRYESDFLFGDGGSGGKIAEILAKVEPEVQKKFHEL